MTTTVQPSWRFLRNLGDVHPIDHGGYFVFEDTTGVYAPEAEILEPPPDDVELDDDRARWIVYRFILEPCTYHNGILSDNPYHPGIPAWFAHLDDPDRPQDTTYLSDLARFAGLTAAELAETFTSEDPIDRAFGWRFVGDYHGFDNLDQSPLILTRSEVESRYSGIL